MTTDCTTVRLVVHQRNFWCSDYYRQSEKDLDSGCGLVLSGAQAIPEHYLNDYSSSTKSSGIPHALKTPEKQFKKIFVSPSSGQPVYRIAISNDSF
jgi:hypothetical protein